MIQVENDVFTELATAIRIDFPGAAISGEDTQTPAKFPAVIIEEKDNFTDTKTQSSNLQETHAVLMYEISAYSNKSKGKKSECKKIMALIDTKMSSIGFTRKMLNPIPNLEDATIYKMTARYDAVVDQTKTFYRR